MKKELKGFIAGAVMAVFLTSSVAIADTVSKTIEVVYNSVNLTVNGAKVAADNILYDGTTYVPLRAMAEMMGKEVGWDQATMTASINDAGFKPATPVDSSAETLSQKNAVAKANDYLSYTAFSKKGLIKQLEYEGFNNADANYAVSKISVDWNEQAVKKANDYLDYSSFSHDGLIKQLEFEGFTNAEAVHAVNTIGL